MTSFYKKIIHGHPYWYLREMGWVDGRAKMVSERYVGGTAEIEALLDAREQQRRPERVPGGFIAVCRMFSETKDSEKTTNRESPGLSFPAPARRSAAEHQHFEHGTGH